MPQDDNIDPAGLIAQAKEGLRADRRRLLLNMSDLFIAGEERLSEHERNLMLDIIGKLVQQVESDVAAALGEQLARMASAPRDLVVRLAHEGVDVARPLILQSPVLRDIDLIELVRHRSQEHRLSVAMRSGLSEQVAQVLVDQGDDDVIETLLRNPDSRLSTAAIEYLVEESRRVDRFQEPLLRRQDLPKRLAYRMFWWVSAVLRRHILAEFTISEADLDDAIEQAVAVMAAEPVPEHNSARVLIDHLADNGQLTGRSLIGLLRGGRVTAFIVALARRSACDPATTRRIFFSSGTEAFAAICKSADIDRNDFATLFLLRREPAARGRALPAAHLQQILEFYDRIAPAQARTALKYWMRDRAYLETIIEVEQSEHVVPPVAGKALPK